MNSLKARVEVFKRRRRLDETIPKVFIDELIDSLESKVEEMQKAFEAIHVIASETFESHNQLELIRLKAVEHLKGGETK